MSASVPGSPFWGGMSRTRGSRRDNAPIQHLPPGAAEGSHEMNKIKVPRNDSPEAKAKFRRDYGSGTPQRRFG